MITKVFREQIQKLELTTNQELDAIFSNITDIAELTITLIGSLEDTLEMAEDGQVWAKKTVFREKFLKRPRIYQIQTRYDIYKFENEKYVSDNIS